MTTWKIPRLALIEIDVSDRPGNEIEIRDLASQIVCDEFFICGVKSKPWWQILLHFKSTKKIKWNEKFCWVLAGYLLGHLKTRRVMEKDGGLMNKRKIEEEQWKILIGYFTM